MQVGDICAICRGFITHEADHHPDCPSHPDNTVGDDWCPICGRAYETDDEILDACDCTDGHPAEGA